MSHKFDNYGWYAGEGEGDRTTDVAPINLSQTTVPGELRANFTGYDWRDTPYFSPATPIDAPVVRHITILAFRNRFTAAEKIAIEMAALDNPAGIIAARLQAAAIRVNLADIAAARYIDLDWPDTRQGVQDMEAGGLLAAGRAAAILDSPVLDVERALA